MTSKKPRILFFDIETRYIIFRGWRTGKQWVDQSQIVMGEDSDIICISYKWLGEKEIHSLDWGLKAQDSSKMLKTFGEVVESADVCIGHNADSFDIRHINTQRLLHHQPPIAWPTSEDTLKQVRKMFYLPSYRLDYLSKLLHGEGKEPTDFNLWVRVVEQKDPEALKRMIAYNRNDVRILEKDYKILAPHLKPKASRALIMGNPSSACPSCGSIRTVSRGLRTLVATRQQRRRCQDCGHGFGVKRPVVSE